MNFWEEVTDASIEDSNFNSVKGTETNQKAETMQAEKGRMPRCGTSQAHRSLVGRPVVASACDWLLLYQSRTVVCYHIVALCKGFIFPFWKDLPLTVWAFPFKEKCASTWLLNQTHDQQGHTVIWGQKAESIPIDSEQYLCL